MSRASLLSTASFVLLPAILAFPATARAQPDPRDEARQAQAAARCLERFARGETPPSDEAPVASPSTRPAQAREALGRCLALAMPFPSRLTSEQAGWLAPCLEGAARALRGARRPARVARARLQRDGCRAVGEAMSGWDPDVSMLTAGRRRAHPEVHVVSIGPAGSLTLGQTRIAAALDAVADSIATCRASHGNGKVRVVAQSGARWAMHAWPVEGRAALARCVERAVRGAALPEGSAETIAVDIALTEPRPMPEALPRALLLGALSSGAGIGSLDRANGIGAGLGLGARSRPAAACEQRIEGLSQRLGPPTTVPPLVIRESQVPEVPSGAPITSEGAVINIYQTDFPVVLDSENTQADGEAAGAIIARRVPRDRALYVAAHRDVAVSRLFAILGPLRDRGAVYLIVRGPEPAPSEPPRGPVAVAGEITAALGTCEEGMAVMRRLGQRLPLHRANALRAELPPVLRRCGCQAVDLERLGGLLDSIVAEPPGLRALPFTLAGPGSRGLRLPAGATVRDLARAAAAAPSDRPATFAR